MDWIDPNAVNWRQLLDDDKIVVAMIWQGEITDVVCGRVSMFSTRGEVELESLHQGKFGFYTYQVVKIIILENS